MSETELEKKPDNLYRDLKLKFTLAGGLNSFLRKVTLYRIKEKRIEIVKFLTTILDENNVTYDIIEKYISRFASWYNVPEQTRLALVIKASLGKANYVNYIIARVNFSDNAIHLLYECVKRSIPKHLLTFATKSIHKMHSWGRFFEDLLPRIRNPYGTLKLVKEIIDRTTEETIESFSVVEVLKSLSVKDLEKSPMSSEKLFQCIEALVVRECFTEAKKVLDFIHDGNATISFIKLLAKRRSTTYRHVRGVKVRNFVLEKYGLDILEHSGVNFKDTLPVQYR